MPEGSGADGFEGLREALGRALYVRRKGLGFTQAQVGGHANVHASVVSRAERGDRFPDRAFWEAADECVRGRGELLGQYDDLQRKLEQAARDVGTPARTDMVAAARVTVPSCASAPMSVGSVVHPELLDRLEVLTGVYRYLDYQQGARSVTAEVATHLDRLHALADAVPSALRSRYHLAVGDAAQLAAWLAVDRQDYGLARALCGTAMAHSAMADASDLHAYVMGILGYIDLHANQGREALQVLHGAVRVATNGRKPASPAVLAWLFEAMGEAHALAGERADGARALARAETIFDGVTAVPPWLGFFDGPAHLARLKGRCLMRLGDGRQAIIALEEARALLPAHYVREQSGTLIDLAGAHLLSGVADPAAAADAAIGAYELAVVTRSDRNVRRVRELLPSFAPYRTIPEVKALAGALR